MLGQQKYAVTPLGTRPRMQNTKSIEVQCQEEEYSKVTHDSSNNASHQNVRARLKLSATSSNMHDLLRTTVFIVNNVGHNTFLWHMCALISLHLPCISKLAHLLLHVSCPMHVLDICIQVECRSNGTTVLQSDNDACY